LDQHGIAFDLIVLGSVARIIPVYLGIAVALMTLKALNRGRQIFLIGLSVGILLSLFFDMMHEEVELTTPRDFGSWGGCSSAACSSASSVLWLLSNKENGSAEAPRLY